jgi:hypothetical protein
MTKVVITTTTTTTMTTLVTLIGCLTLQLMLM